MNIAQIKKNKKGFTIIELVIVIAVIAILAAVLIPTFSTVIEKSHKSNALSRAKSAYTEIVASKDGGSATDFASKGAAIQVLENGKYYVFSVDTKGKLAAVANSPFDATKTEKTGTGYTVPSSMDDVKLVTA